MTLGREWKLILLFTLPIMAGSFLQQLYNTVDGIVVGNWVGEDAFAGVGTCSPLVFLFLAFAMGLGVGAGVTVSQYFGARKMKELSAAVDTSLILMSIFGICFAVVGYITTPFLLRVVLDTPENILPYSILYFRIYCIGLVFQFIYNGIAFVLRGMGDSKATLYFLLISTVLNALLAVLFVIAFHWGVAGTAVATVIAQVVCAGVSYIYLKKRFKFEGSGRHFDSKMCRHILRFGIPSAIQQTIVSLGGTAMQRLVNGFGEAAIAAYAASLRINMLMSVPIFGFQAGLASFTGQNIGAGRIDRVKRGFHATLVMGLILSVILCALTYFFAPGVVKAFALTGDALALGVEQTQFFAIVFCAFSYYAIIGGVLQGAGDVVLQSVATLSALIIRVVLGYVGVHFGFMGYEAAWITNPMGWVASIAITTIRYASGKWKTKAVASLGSDAGDAAALKACAETDA
ncbi:putative efflux protein, MATE family [Sporobacter termitidis DSM 10068]|uniref:Probable multidrug resistance protein NorM n=2 Tax=Sporobacter TaxID=44748 RepID=A0A1M5YGX8_9FIRM|nr:putative efflux protein, MATE family [Sporobacter termitidis DSM 10068]